MKGGKDEEKMTGPLFPRLHINDADKGGPKAPPRNKMALYEQLSIPSQRYTPGSSKMLPNPHNNTGNSVPFALSSHRTSPYSPLGNTPASHLAERLHSHTSVGANLNTSSTNRAWQHKMTSECQSSRDPGHFSITAPCSYFQLHNLSTSKSSSIKRLGDEDDCRVPAFVQTGNSLNCIDGERKMDKEDLLNTRRNGHLQSTSVKQLNQTSTMDVLSKHHMSTEGNLRVPSSCEDDTRKPASHLENRDELLEKRSGFVNDLSRLNQKYKVLQKTKVLENGIRADTEHTLEKSNGCALEGASDFKPSLEDHHRSHNNEHGALQLGKAGRNAEITETCILDSASSVNISPDAVVDFIGQKQFLKARRAIVHQQRVFQVQVFELHRLIKVQKLFAESPDLLLENRYFLGKPSIEVLPEKNLRLENAPEGPTTIAQPMDDPQIPNLSSESEPGKGLDTLLSNYKPHSASDANPSPWCFHPPPGNQWLVPVMSPSEGLIYKPYSGPCPPTTGFVGPFHGNCGPMGLPPLGEEFARFRFFSPYCIPSLNASVSSSPVEQVSPLVKAQPKSKERENHSTREPYFTMPYPSSFNISSGVNSYCMKKWTESKESGVQASTASSSDIKLQGDALPLFPTAPILDESEKTQRTMNRTRVIKVVPHNARSASESAARIFQSIQEERRQLD